MSNYINPYKLFRGSFVPNWLLCRHELSQGAKLCYARLSHFAGKDGHAYPAQQTLADELGCSEREARRYLVELQKAGLIEAKRRGLGKTNYYRFLLHEWQGLTVSDGTDVSSHEETDTSSTDETNTSHKESHRRESVKGSDPSDRLPWPNSLFKSANNGQAVAAVIDMWKETEYNSGLVHAPFSRGILASVIKAHGTGEEVRAAAVAAATKAEPSKYMKAVLNGKRDEARRRDLGARAGNDTTPIDEARERW